MAEKFDRNDAVFFADGELVLMVRTCGKTRRARHCDVREAPEAAEKAFDDLSLELDVPVEDINLGVLVGAWPNLRTGSLSASGVRELGRGGFRLAPEVG